MDLTTREEEVGVPVVMLVTILVVPKRTTSHADLVVAAAALVAAETGAAGVVAAGVVAAGVVAAVGVGAAAAAAAAAEVLPEISFVAASEAIHLWK